MKQINKILSLLLVTTFLVVLSTSVSATFAVTMTSPETGFVISGAESTNISNVSITATGTGDTDWNCSVYAKSTLTANSSWSRLIDGEEVINSSQTTWNMTFDSSLIEDANNLIFNASCTNSSRTINEGLAEVLTTGIIIDNTVPTTPTLIVPSDNSIDTDGNLIFNVSVEGNETTSCTLRFNNVLPPGGNNQVMTHSGEACYLAILAVPEQTYDWFVRASDETNTSDSSEFTIGVNEPTPHRGALILKDQPAKTRTGMALAIGDAVTTDIGGIPIWAIVLVAIVAVIVIVKIRKK